MLANKKLLIIQDVYDKEIGLMLVPDWYDDKYALKQADGEFLESKIMGSFGISIPANLAYQDHRDYRLYRWHRPA